KDLETEDLILFVNYLENQLKKEGVTVHMKKEVTKDLVKTERPDVVIVAAGPEHATFDIPGGDSSKVIKAGEMHGQLKFFLKFFSSAQMEKLSKLYMPVGKKVVIVGGTLHGCELAEFLTKRGRDVAIVHNGPKEELGDKMTVDDLDNLWPWLKQKGVPIWSDVKYEKVTDDGLEVQLKDQRRYVIKAKHIIDTQDLIPNSGLSDTLEGLVPEVYNIGSSKEPGLIVDAMREGAKIAYAI
ncbi:MAG: FAD-dependent oxidoreductase, partial [Desulfobacterium sp.]